jgi:hypothetical protein
VLETYTRSESLTLTHPETNSSKYLMIMHMVQERIKEAY